MLRLLDNDPTTAIDAIVPNRTAETQATLPLTQMSAATVASYAYCHPLRRSRKRRASFEAGADHVKTTWF